MYILCHLSLNNCHKFQIDKKQSLDDLIALSDQDVVFDIYSCCFSGRGLDIIDGYDSDRVKTFGKYMT